MVVDGNQLARKGTFLDEAPESIFSSTGSAVSTTASPSAGSEAWISVCTCPPGGAVACPKPAIDEAERKARGQFVRGNRKATRIDHLRELIALAETIPSQQR